MTNCTYDGLCYHAAQLEEALEQSVSRIHFDEAWYSYARFNPMYRDRFAMRGDPADHPVEGPTIFATQSTHKLLAALSQASYLHVRNGRNPVEHSRFNEAYMQQTSTSPLYAIIASNEVGAAMMDGPNGKTLTQEVIQEAVDFRQALAIAHREFAGKGDWFFWPWNAPIVTDSKTGASVSFADADPELLSNDPRCWILRAGETWHGFEGIDENWCLLDPIKAGIVCPGMGDDGEFEKTGIPAPIVTAYLYRHGIIPSRTTNFMILCLFSIGITKGKWGTLINTLLDFKTDYDKNGPLSAILPELVTEHPTRYAKLGLRDLSDEMFAQMILTRMDAWQARAFGQLPKAEMTPRKAFFQLQSGQAELLPLSRMANRITTVGIIPYPPGIPILMPGENVGPDDGPWLTYLRVLQAWDNRFPGFESVVEGTVMQEDIYHVWCIK